MDGGGVRAQEVLEQEELAGARETGEPSTSTWWAAGSSVTPAASSTAGRGTGSLRSRARSRATSTTKENGFVR
ncbi:hypothetical protein TAE01_02610 [Terrabacter aerolatus]|uniref:Uncharacterized protein n=1 Tax=Terrabacter aerolatus TaxID=422442 RepID=A0A512CW37_9MICO|nr:hypothetical protein TAE01_02610 [Terrabacter aerolatus]